MVVAEEGEEGKMKKNEKVVIANELKVKQELYKQLTSKDRIDELKGSHIVISPAIRLRFFNGAPWKWEVGFKKESNIDCGIFFKDCEKFNVGSSERYLRALLPQLQKCKCIDEAFELITKQQRGGLRSVYEKIEEGVYHEIPKEDKESTRYFIAYLIHPSLKLVGIIKTHKEFTGYEAMDLAYIQRDYDLTEGDEE